MTKETLRGAFSQKILEEAKTDSNIVVVCSDSRGSAQLGEFPIVLPEQFVEVGIAEQNAVTVAAGLATVGKKVFVVGPASFYSLRAAEQIKVDVAYSNTNVKILGISGGISYGALGATHHSLQDIAVMRAIPNLIVEIPSDAHQMRAITEKMLAVDEPAYIRVGRGAVPNVYDADKTFEIGKAEWWYGGRDACIITCGQMLHRSLEAAQQLEKSGISITVLDMHTIKPLDETSVLRAAEHCNAILTVDEHSLYGGLGGAIAEVLAQKCDVPFEIAALPDSDMPNGTDDEVFQYFNLDANGIAGRIKQLIAR